MERARADEHELVLARSSAETEAEATRLTLEVRGLKEELAASRLEVTKAAEKASKLAAAERAEQLLAEGLREEEEAAQSRRLEVALRDHETLQLAHDELLFNSNAAFESQSYYEDAIGSLKDDLAEALQGAKGGVSDVGTLRSILARLPLRRGEGGRVYSDDDNKLFLRLAACNVSSTALVDIYRLIMMHIFGDDAKEGVAWEAPSLSLIDARRAAISSVNDQIGGGHLASAETWDVVGNDSTKMKRVDAQSAWVTTDGVMVSLPCVQPATTAEETNNCLVRSVGRLGEAYQTTLDELARRGESGVLAKLALADGVDLRKVSCAMNDGCATAKLAASLLGKSILERRKVYFIHIGGTEKEWDELPADSLEKLFCRLLCAHHQRALLSKEYLVSEKELDRDFINRLPATDSTLPARSWDLGLDSICRSLGKLIGGQKQVNTYAKGERELFFAFVEERRGDELFFDMGRGELGSRHDWFLTVCFGCFFNLEMIEQYLEDNLYRGENILRDSTLVRLGCLYVKAKLFVAAVRFDKVEDPLRALIALKSIGLTPADLSVVFQRLYEVAERLLSADETTMMFFYSENYSVFAELEDLEDECAALKVWYLAKGEVLKSSLNGNRKFPAVRMAREHLYNARGTDDWGNMVSHVLCATKAWAQSTMKSLERNAGQYLPGGDLCRSEQSETKRALLKKAVTTNDSSERLLGAAKARQTRAPTMLVSTLLAGAQAATMKTLAPQPAEGKYKRKNGEEHEAAMDLCRKNPSPCATSPLTSRTRSFLSLCGWRRKGPQSRKQGSKAPVRQFRG
jgi:hypothetical protein